MKSYSFFVLVSLLIVLVGGASAEATPGQATAARVTDVADVIALIRQAERLERQAIAAGRRSVFLSKVNASSRTLRRAGAAARASLLAFDVRISASTSIGKADEIDNQPTLDDGDIRRALKFKARAIATIRRATGGLAERDLGFEAESADSRLEDHDDVAFGLGDVDVDRVVISTRAAIPAFSSAAAVEPVGDGSNTLRTVECQRRARNAIVCPFDPPLEAGGFMIISISGQPTGAQVIFNGFTPQAWTGVATLTK